MVTLRRKREGRVGLAEKLLSIRQYFHTDHRSQSNLHAEHPNTLLSEACQFAFARTPYYATA